MVLKTLYKDQLEVFEKLFSIIKTGSISPMPVLTKTQTKCILNIVFNSRHMNRSNTAHQRLADRLTTLDSDDSLELLEETLNSRGKLQAFVEALPELDLSATVRNMLLVLLATLMITACGGNGTDFPDGDNVDTPVDGDTETDVDQETIDGDSADNEADTETATDGDENESDGDEEETDGDAESDDDVIPCSQFEPHEALTVAHVCSHNEPAVFTISGVDENEPYAVYNNVSVITQFEGCGCVLARPACDSQFNEMLTACGIRFVVTEEYGGLYDTLHADFKNLFYPKESLSLFTIDLDTDTPSELSSTLAEHQGLHGTLANDFRVVCSSQKTREATEDEYIAYFRDKLPEIESVVTHVNGTTLTVDLAVSDDGHDVFSETYLNNFGTLQVEFNDNATGTACNLNETDTAGQFKADFEPGTYNFVLTIAPNGMDISESEIKKSFSFTIEPQDLCENVSCGNNASCIVADDQAACKCETGFEGNADESCTDIDGCADDPCEEGYQCTDNPAPSLDATCTDIDECDDDPCQTGETCENTEGGYQCIEIDGCSAENNPCDENATCTDNLAPDTGASCECNEGFKGDGESCEEILVPEVSNLSIDTQGFCVAGRSYPVTFDVANVDNVEDCTVTPVGCEDENCSTTYPYDPNYDGTISDLQITDGRATCNYNAPSIGGGFVKLSVTCETEDGTATAEMERAFLVN